MQTLKEEVRASIIAAAVDEFSMHGFEKASMRRIAGSAGISVSNTYNYYKNKEQLFAEIIDPVYRQTKILFQQSIDGYSGSVLQGGDILSFSDDIVGTLVKLDEYQRRLILILAEKSDGTKYAGSKKELVGLVRHHLLTVATGSADRTEYHEKLDYSMGIIAENYIDGLLSVIRDYRSREWVEENIRILATYHLNGMKALM